MNNFYNISTIKNIILAIVLLLGVGTSNLLAQGWEIYFGGLDLEQNKDDYGRAVITLADGGYLLVGDSESFGDDNDTDIYVVRTDADGQEIWSKIYDEGFIERAYTVKQMNNGNFIIAGSISNFAGQDSNAYFLEINQEGDLIWSNQYTNEGNDAIYDVVEANDGGLVFAGKINNATEDVNAFILKTDATGNTEWTKQLGGAEEDIAHSITNIENGYAVFGQNRADNATKAQLNILNNAGDITWERLYEFDTNNYGRDIIQTQDGSYVVTGYKVSPSESTQAFLAKLNATNGDVQWLRSISADLGVEAVKVLETETNDIVILGSKEVSTTNIDVLLAKYDSAGTMMWQKEIGRPHTVDRAEGMCLSGKGGITIVGYNSLDAVFEFHDVTLIRTDVNGNIHSNRIEGKVFFDENNNCAENAGETGLTEWIVVAEGTENTYYSSSDETGKYSILLDTGTYNITVLPKNNYWNPCVANYNNVQLTTFYDTAQLNFPIHNVIDCPLLNVDVSAPSAQTCADIVYTVTYCNDGTTTAQNPYIEVILDEDFTFNSASSTVTNISENTLTFQALADLPAGQCGSFTISVSSDCGGIPLSTYSVSAHIFPDEDCTPVNPDWDGADIMVSGYCDADSIRFTIQNAADNAMTVQKEYIVIEDIVMGLQVPYQLGGNEVQEVAVAATGATYRLIAEQADGHPGNSYPTVAVEGCATDGQEITTGNVTIFQENENDPYVSIDVQEIDDVNSLKAFPKGYPSYTGDSLLIEANTPIQYHINFENASNDTVQHLIIRDTLPFDALDISTFEEGASSHNYTLTIYSGGIVKFVFDEMNLAANQAGFLQFKISPKADLSVGTKISNHAEITMGYNTPILTNTVTHYIGGETLQGFIIIDLVDSTIETFVPNTEITAFPNPFVAGMTISIKGIHLKESVLRFYHANGKLLQESIFQGNQAHISRGNLPKGTYFFSVESEGKLITTGKAVVQ